MENNSLLEQFDDQKYFGKIKFINFGFAFNSTIVYFIKSCEELKEDHPAWKTGKRYAIPVIFYSIVDLKVVL